MATRTMPATCSAPPVVYWPPAMPGMASVGSPVEAATAAAAEGLREGNEARGSLQDSYDDVVGQRVRLLAQRDDLTAQLAEERRRCQAGRDTLIAERDDLAAQLSELRNLRMAQAGVCAELRAELAQARAASTPPAAPHSS